VERYDLRPRATVVSSGPRGFLATKNPGVLVVKSRARRLSLFQNAPMCTWGLEHRPCLLFHVGVRRSIAPVYSTALTQSIIERSCIWYPMLSSLSGSLSLSFLPLYSICYQGSEMRTAAPAYSIDSQPFCCRVSTP
jgi:hypothetical protein